MQKPSQDTPTKVYAVVCDASPSEQLTGDADAVISIGMLIGLRSRQSFDELGSDYPDESLRMPLRKWSGSSKAYRKRFVEFADQWQQSGNVMYGAEVADERAIFLGGSTFYQQHMGRFPEPSSHNLKGRPRVAMGGYQVDGVVVPKWEVLIDDLCVLGWYANALHGLYEMLVDINADPSRGTPQPTRLEVLKDKLANEQGGDDNYKGTLLKQLLLKSTSGGVEVMGVPELSDTRQRDLMVDNLAGLRRQLEQGTWKASRSAADDLYRFNRKNIGPESLSYHGRLTDQQAGPSLSSRSEGS